MARLQLPRLLHFYEFLLSIVWCSSLPVHSDSVEVCELSAVMKTIEFVLESFIIIIKNKAKLKTTFCPCTILSSIGSLDATPSFRIL